MPVPEREPEFKGARLDGPLATRLRAGAIAARMPKFIWLSNSANPAEIAGNYASGTCATRPCWPRKLHTRQNRDRLGLAATANAPGAAPTALRSSNARATQSLTLRAADLIRDPGAHES